ncbi:hypothetical protein CBL_07585 [Carabus blaptoides fortunei]
MNKTILDVRIPEPQQFIAEHSSLDIADNNHQGNTYTRLQQQTAATKRSSSTSLDVNHVMGCNGSKSVTVLHTDESAPPADPPGASGEDAERPASVAASNHEVTSRPETAGESNTRPVTPQPVPPSMAFDVPLDHVPGSASIVKRHPPRRLQRLEEQQQQLVPLSLQELQEKQQDAEHRRLQFLQMRAQSAKRKYALRNTSPHTSAENATEIVDIESKEEEEEEEKGEEEEKKDVAAVQT